MNRNFDEYDALLDQNRKLFLKLYHSTIFLTGATGFIGSLLLKFCLYLNQKQNAGIRILAYVRNKEKANEMLGDVSDSVKLIEGNIENINSNLLQEEHIDYIIHCAAITRSAQMISQPVEVINGIVDGTKNVLELARRNRIKSMVYLSSMEVYGKLPVSEKPVSENQLGDIDIYSTRSCYPLSKRTAENYCYSYYKEYGVPVKIARLAQTFGYGILRGENRVFAQFAEAVRKNHDIILHTEGNSMGNYIDSFDCLKALIRLLVNGEDGEAYNVVNEVNTMKIREMAELAASKVAGGNIKVIYDIPQENKFGYAADTGLRLSSEKLRALGWKPKVSLEQMYRNMIDWMDNEGME